MTRFTTCVSAGPVSLPAPLTSAASSGPSIRTERKRGPVCIGGGVGAWARPGTAVEPGAAMTGAGATTGTAATGGAGVGLCFRYQRYPPEAIATARNSTHPRPPDLRRADWPSTGIFTDIVARPPPRSLVALVAKRELLHLGLQRLPADLQELRRAGDVAASLLERAGDQILLQLRGALPHDVLEPGLPGRRGQRSGERRGRSGKGSGAARGPQALRQIAHTDLRPIGEQEGPLDEVLQLPDVSGPGVRLEDAHGL